MVIIWRYLMNNIVRLLTGLSWVSSCRLAYCLLACALLGVSLSAIAVAEQSVAGRQISLVSGAFKTPVIELYTSEGCSSCPPADNWLRQLGQSLDENFNAVPLAFHVDYWNYLGWTDAYSKPAFTTRQRQVPANRRRGGIYTPEFVVDGREARGGDAALRLIRNANSQPATATIRVQVLNRTPNENTNENTDTDHIEARIEVENHAATDDAHAYLAIFESGITREIGGGENHGKTLKHDFVVRYWSQPIIIRRGANQAGIEVKIPADWNRPNLGLAVVVLDSNSGETMQAVRTSLALLFAG